MVEYQKRGFWMGKKGVFVLISVFILFYFSSFAIAYTCDTVTVTVAPNPANTGATVELRAETIDRGDNSDGDGGNYINTNWNTGGGATIIPGDVNWGIDWTTKPGYAIFWQKVTASNTGGTYSVTFTGQRQTLSCSSSPVQFTISAPTPSCSDNIKSGNEADVDCGGSCPSKCALGKACNSNSDCSTNYCDSTKKCAQATTPPPTTGNRAPKIETLQTPATINAGDTANINVTYSDEDGADNMAVVWFGIYPSTKGDTGEAYCTSAFELPLANYLGAGVRMRQGNVYYVAAFYDSSVSTAPSPGCPWSREAQTGELTNKPATARIVEINQKGGTNITKTGNQLIASFKINLGSNFPAGDYNIYSMVRDGSLFQTGTTNAVWNKIGSISVRNSAPPPPANAKYSWDYTKTGTCSQQSQCFVGDGKCIDNGQSIADHYCSNGEWTSRTKFAALRLLEYADTNKINDYVLFCGNYTETTNYFEYAVDTTPIVDYLENVNSICVLKYSDRVIFGAVLNKSLQDSGFLNVLKNAPGSECQTGSGMYACDNTNTIWHDSDKKIVYYSSTPITLSTGAIQSFIEAIIDFFRNLLSFAAGGSASSTSSNIEIVKQTQDFNRIYLNTKGTKRVFGVIEKKFSNNKLTEVMGINYSGFSTNICSFIDEKIAGRCENRAGKYYVSFSKESGQPQANDLFPYWSDLTAKLRVGECLIPKTAADCTGTQGSRFCGDENGGSFNANAANPNDRACCASPEKVVIDGVCLTPCVDSDNDKYGAGEACTDIQDCDDSNPYIRPNILKINPNSNPYCDCDSSDGFGQGTAEICRDGIDNDCDGKTDSDDEECVLPLQAGCKITDKFCANNFGVLSFYNLKSEEFTNNNNNNNVLADIPNLGIVSFPLVYDSSKGEWGGDKNNNFVLANQRPGAYYQYLLYYNPSVLLKDGTYRMWLSTGLETNGNGVRYATSTDGINWNVAPDFAIVIPDVSITCVRVLYDEGKYKMWYGAEVIDRNAMPMASNVYLRYASSNDGINWAKDDANLMLLSEGTPVEIDMGCFSVLHDSNYKLWFAKGADSYYAASDNGISWSAPSKVLENGQVSSVSYNERTQNYNMLFDKELGIYSAVSMNGVNWNSPVLRIPKPPEETKNNFVYKPEVFGAYALPEGDTYKIWYNYMPYAGSANYGSMIAYATMPKSTSVLRGDSHAGAYGKGPLNLCCSDKTNANCQFRCTFNTREPGSLDVIGLYKQENSHVADTDTQEGSSLDNKIYCKLSGDCGNKVPSDCLFYSRSTGNDCPPDTVSKSYQCIASAYSTTNAHLGECNYYDYNICCEISLR